MSSEQRRVFLINPRFQIIFMSFMGLVSLISIAILYGVDFYFFWKLKKIGLDLGLNEGSVYFQYLDHQRIIMREIVVATSALLLAVISFSGMIFSHRICGPLHRLKMHMLGIASGKKPGPLNFRTTDFFPEIANSFNSMMGRIDKSPRSSKKSPSKKAA